MTLTTEFTAKHFLKMAFGNTEEAIQTALRTAAKYSDIKNQIAISRAESANEAALELIEKQSDQRRKLITLAERGATEGERNAARNKLDQLHAGWDMSDEALLKELGAL